MDRRYTPLLPASSPFPINVYLPVQDLYGEKLAARRAVIATACEECRVKKAKCDGQRPRCARCLNQGTQCQFVAQEGETRSLAMKRRYIALKEEAAQLRELYDILRSKSQEDAFDIFNRIRATSDPLAVLELVKAAERLLPISESGAYERRPVQLGSGSLKCGPIQVTTLQDDSPSQHGRAFGK